MRDCFLEHRCEAAAQLWKADRFNQVTHLKRHWLTGEHPHRRLAIEQVLHIEGHHLGDAQPRAVEQLDEAAVAQAQRGAPARRLDEGEAVVDADHVGERQAVFDALSSQSAIAADSRPDAGWLRGDAGDGVAVLPLHPR